MARPPASTSPRLRLLPSPTNAPVGATRFAPCAPRPNAARRCFRPRIRSSSPWRMPVRPNGTARIRPGSSSNFVLVPHLKNYQIFDDDFAFLFNSYYVAAGPRHARPKRGLLTRPSADRIAAYRAHVDAAVERLLDDVGTSVTVNGHRTDRTRPQSRTATSGIADHRHSARVCAESDRARLRSRLAAACHRTARRLCRVD